MKIPLVDRFKLGFIALALLVGALQVSGQDADTDHTPDVEMDVAWDRLLNYGDSTIRRTKIPEGWLLIVETNAGATTELIRDPEHAWLKPEAAPLPEHDAFSAYVASDKETWEALRPHLMKYLRYVAKKPEDTQVKKIMERWKLRIAMAGK